MLSAVIAASGLGIMLLIIVSLIFSAWRARQRHKRALTSLSNLPAHPLDRHVTAILHIHDGQVMKVEEPPTLPVFQLPTSWYTRRRTLVSLGFLIMLVLTLSAQSVLSEGAIRSITQELHLGFGHDVPASDVHLSAHPIPLTPSARLVRIDSAARNQYYTDYQWQVWAYSSCSGISMAMVMNSYGRHYIAADVLQEELNLGVWSVQLGLLREEGIALTAAQYGFTTSSGHTRTMDEVISIANKGAPVIVSLRDGYYFPNGHLFVVRGGDAQYVYIADSSPANFQRMTRGMFAGMWQGFSAVLTPRP